MNARRYERTCVRCGANFMAAKPDARYCGGRCRRSACEERKRGTCAVCGSPTAKGTAWASRGPTEHLLRCAACRAKAEAEAAEALASRYEALWAEGKTLREIAEEMGLKDKLSAGAVISMYRAEGRNFPYRRTGQALENVRANSWGRKKAAA